MPNQRVYRWQAQDDIWFIASRFLAESGYPDVSTFVDAIWAVNPSIIDRAAITAGTLVILPYTSS